jgi:hypothetical protein
MAAPLAVGFCPHPPVLHPAVASGAAGELVAVRDACAAVVRALAASGAEGVLVIGGGPQTATHAPDAVGSFRGYGVDVAVTLAGAAAPPGRVASLPLSLTVAGWLLGVAGWDRGVAGLAVGDDEPPDRCAALGREVLAGAGTRSALLVMGDGSARRSAQAPGYHDPRAGGFDDGVARALAGADAAALLALDADLAADLLVAGRAAWQVAAAATAGAGYEGRLLARADPYGVDYAVARWTRQPGPGR